MSLVGGGVLDFEGPSQFYESMKHTKEVQLKSSNNVQKSNTLYCFKAGVGKLFLQNARA